MLVGQAALVGTWFSHFKRIIRFQMDLRCRFGLACVTGGPGGDLVLISLAIGAHQ